MPQPRDHSIRSMHHLARTPNSRFASLPVGAGLRPALLGLQNHFGLLTLSLLTTLILIGCTTPPTPTPPTDQNTQSRATTGPISATGKVIPATWASLSFATSGQVTELLVSEGDTVEAGDVIARLDTTDLDLAVTSAEASLAVAEANYDLARSGPREAEIERAENQLAAATARVSVAVAQRNQLNEPADADLVITAQSEVEQAQQTQEDLQQAYDSLIAWANANLENWDYESDLPNPMDNETNLRYQVQMANLQLAAAQAELEKLLSGPTPDQKRVADARVWAAVAQREAAQAYLDLVKSGATAEDVAIADARVEQARAAVASARAARDKAVLTAPFDGTVSALNIHLGEAVGAGAPMLILADLTTLQIETTDLNEIDVARLSIGDSATITFDALPNLTIEGEVISIAPKSTEGAGVNYAVIIQLNDLPDALRWGMTAFIEIDTD